MDDPAYKRLLTHRRIARDLLTGFVAPQRPAGWADALDFSTLRDRATENVTDALRRRLGDVVWSIDRSDGRGGVQTLHVVIEHQSRVDYSMPLRFLNYTSLLYQRLYRDRTTWSKDDRADPVLHVVVYNGDKRWDAPLTLASLVQRTEQDGPAQLAASYDVVDLVAVKADDLPRPNLLRWVAEVEQSVLAGALPERVRELGEWLAEAGEPGLTRSFDLWLGVLGRRWGVELPSIREYEEVSAVLLEKIDRWGAEILEQGIEQGIERHRVLLHRLAERRFGPAAAAVGAARRRDRRGSPRRSGGVDRGLRRDCRLPGPREPCRLVAGFRLHATPACTRACTPARRWRPETVREPTPLALARSS